MKLISIFVIDFKIPRHRTRRCTEPLSATPRVFGGVWGGLIGIFFVLPSGCRGVCELDVGAIMNKFICIRILCVFSCFLPLTGCDSYTLTKNAKKCDATVLLSTFHFNTPLYYAGSDANFHYFWHPIKNQKAYLRTSVKRVSVSHQFTPPSMSKSFKISADDITEIKKPQQDAAANP